MNTDNIHKISQAHLAWCKRHHLVSVITLGLACTLIPSVAFAQNNSPDPDPDVEAGSYISLNLNQDIVAVGDPITGTSSIYEGDGDVDSDDSITATSDAGYTQTADGTVSFSAPTTNYGDISITGSSADAGSVSKIVHAVAVNTKLTPTDNFTGRSQTTYGVGEVVNLSFTTSPPGYESQIGTPSWSGMTQAGTGLITQAGASGTFTAGDIADSVSIILSIIDGPLKGKSYSKDRSVVPPSGVTLVQTGGVIHYQGLATAGFHASTYFLPKDVSFSNCQEEEEYSATEESKGKKGPVGLGTGSLAGKNGEVHTGGGYHAGGAGNILLGCLIGIDDVEAHNQGLQPFASDGDFIWNIPRDYKVGDTGTVHAAYTTLVQHNHQTKTDANGDSITTESKGGVHVSAKQSDPTSP